MEIESEREREGGDACGVEEAQVSGGATCLGWRISWITFKTLDSYTQRNEGRRKKVAYNKR